MLGAIVAVVSAAIGGAILWSALKDDVSTSDGAEPCRCHLCSADRKTQWITAAVCDDCICDFDEVIPVAPPAGRKMR